jgi:hypothetical protein
MFLTYLTKKKRAEKKEEKTYQKKGNILLLKIKDGLQRDNKFTMTQQIQKTVCKI